MDKSSGSARETGHKFPCDLEYEKKTTHSSSRKWDASSYRTKDHSEPEMNSGENRHSEISHEMALNKHNNTRSRQPLSSLSRISSSPLQFRRVADELTTIQDIMTGIRNEVDAYSKLEHRYVHELEKKLPKSEGMGDIRMQLTVDQLEKIRAYRRNALDQLTEMNEKIAALEARVERIAFEAEEAELNSKLQELEALYCITEAEAAPSVTYTAPEIIAPAPIERPAEKTIETQVQDNSNSANVAQEKEAEIVDELQTLRPTTQMPNKQVQALRQLLGEYKKNNDPLSKSATDNSHDHDNATAFVDTSGGTIVEQQSLQDPGSETIEDLLREHAQGKRASISLPKLKLPRNIRKKKRVLIAGGAGVAAATGAWILESRSGMLSNALSNMMRMLG